jgi:hypothetical protein
MAGPTLIPSSQQSGLGTISEFFDDIYGGLQQIGSAVSPALPAVVGGLLTNEAYDRLSDIGEQSILGTTVGGVRVPGAMEIAERGQAESQFKPFTVTTPTGAMFTARMGGQPSMGQPMPQPVGQPSMALPPNIDQLVSQIDMQLPGQMPQPGQLSPTEARGRLLDLLGSSGSSSQFAPPPGMSARPEMPMIQTADIVQFTDPVTGRQMSGSSSLNQYRRQLKDYYDATPGSQQYYEGLERQQQMERFPDLLGLAQPERPTAQPTTGGLEVGMTLSPQEQAMQATVVWRCRWFLWSSSTAYSSS